MTTKAHGFEQGKPVYVQLTPDEVQYVEREAAKRTARRQGSPLKDTLGNVQETMDFVGCFGEYATHRWLLRKPLRFKDWTPGDRVQNMQVNGKRIRVTTTRRQATQLLWARENVKGEERRRDGSDFMVLCKPTEKPGEVWVVGWMPTEAFYALAKLQPVANKPGRMNYAYNGADMVPAWSLPLALAGLVEYKPPEGSE